MHSMVEKVRKTKDQRRTTYPVGCIVVKAESPHHEQTIDNNSYEDLKPRRWRGKDRDKQSNGGKEMSHLPKSNQHILMVAKIEAFERVRRLTQHLK